MPATEVTSLGIVLSVMPYKEADAILSVYFRDYGKLSLLARGVRKPKSKNSAGCQPYVKANFTFYPSSSLSKLVRIEIIESHYHLLSNMKALSYAAFLCEYYYRGLEDNLPSLAHYTFLDQCLDLLDKRSEVSLLVYGFMNSFILRDVGSIPEVNGCVKCDTNEHIMTISIREGGFLCYQHMSASDVILPVSVLKLFRIFVLYGLEVIDHLLEIDQNDLIQAIHYLELFVADYCPVHFKSLKFIQH